MIYKWFKGCGPATPIMAVYQQEIQQYSSCSVHKAGCLSWSLLYSRIPKNQALIPVKEWTCRPDRGQADKEQNFFFCVLYIDFKQKAWPK